MEFYLIWESVYLQNIVLSMFLVVNVYQLDFQSTDPWKFFLQISAPES